MPLARRILWRSLPLAAITTGFCLLTFLVTQQIWRQMANDQQIQMARDAAVLLEAGRPADAILPPGPVVDMTRSLAPFLIVFNDAGAVVAASGRLRGKLRGVPAGVLVNVRQTGEERVTWQPERGVRIATMIVRYAGVPGGFVLAGRSLSETEERIETCQRLVGLAWLALEIGRAHV